MSSSITGLLIDPRHRSWSGTARRTACILLVVVLSFCLTQVRAHDTRADNDPSNDWIEGLTNRDDEACCGNNDCSPLRTDALRVTNDSTFSVEIDKRWYLVPERNVVPDSSPDGRAWACLKWIPATGGYSYKIGEIRCLLLPPMN